MVAKKGKGTESTGPKIRKVGRDTGTGQFIPIKEAERRKKTAIVETIKYKRKRRKK